jgi:hypothetical protein
MPIDPSKLKSIQQGFNSAPSLGISGAFDKLKQYFGIGEPPSSPSDKADLDMQARLQSIQPNIEALKQFQNQLPTGVNPEDDDQY